MIKLKDLLFEDGGTGAGWGMSNPDYISAGKPKNSKTKPDGLKAMEDDEEDLDEGKNDEPKFYLKVTPRKVTPTSHEHREQMLKYIPKNIGQYTFLGKNDEGIWEITHPQHHDLTITATPFLHGSNVMKIVVEKGEDIIDEFVIAFPPSINQKTKTMDPVRDAERYSRKMREELETKVHPEEF